jgi:peptide/nickel transport system substrate-binding protein
MNTMFRSLRKLFPTAQEIKLSLNLFTRREWIAFFTAATIGLASMIVLIYVVSARFSTVVPIPGGTLSEGIVGAPRFINPTLEISDADKDMTALVYAGLMRLDQTGNPIPNLAESYEISKDGLSYTVVLKDSIYFHDNTPVTVDDILFTIQIIKDPILKSPKRVAWEGVSVQKIDDRTIVFTLKKPFASFLENLTIGILPSHLWNEIPVDQMTFSELNTEAIGAGPYKVSKIQKKSSGVIESFSLTAFKKYSPHEPYIRHINFTFFSNETELVKAINSGSVDSGSALSPENTLKLSDSGLRVEKTVLPRLFALFFNQNQAPLFVDKSVIQALNVAIDRHALLSNVLLGYGIATDSPVPKNREEALQESVIESAERLASATEILTKAGWTKGTDGIFEKKSKTGTTRLSFAITTADNTELKKAAENIQTQLKAFGAEVEVKIYDTGTLNQMVIRPREYEVLLFGQVISHESDYFAFWHSSQRNDPGLNIAMYTNAKVDTLLENGLKALDPETRKKNYTAFETEIKKDMPALFLYSPEFIYVVPKNLKGVAMNHVTLPSDRFLGIADWYIATDTIWNIFR